MKLQNIYASAEEKSNLKSGNGVIREKKTAVPTSNTRRWYRIIISQRIQPFKSVAKKHKERIVKMSNYIKEAISRANLQDIREFLHHGTEELMHSDETYERRLEKGSDAIYKRLENLYPDSKEFDEAQADLSQALTEYSNVYTEVGMKVGARLVHQLLFLEE